MSYWYLATPYTQYPDGLDAAHEAACEIAASLIKRGLVVFCPIAHTHPISQYGFDPLDSDLWLAQDRPVFEGAAGIIVAKLPGWKQSRGIAKEVRWAQEAGKPILYLEVGYE